MLAAIILIIQANFNLNSNFMLVVAHLLLGFGAVQLVVGAGYGLLAQTVGTFAIISFSLMPILELYTETIYWGGGELSVIKRLEAMLAITIFLFMFMLGYRSKIKFKIFMYDKWSIAKFTSLQQVKLFVIICALAVLMLELYNWNYLSLFFRGGENNEGLNVELKSSFLLTEFFLRPLIFNLGLFLFFFSHRNKLLSFAGLAIGCLAIFPTGVPRFLAAAMYMPFLLHWACLNTPLRSTNLPLPRLFLPNLLLLGLVVVFPFLDIFRWYSATLDGQFHVFNLNTVLAGHFDAYQMLVRALDVGDLTYGYGLIGVFLFFVPRSIWETKPNVSGFEVANNSNLYFDNVSMPLVAEFYLNYWYVGILIFSFLFGFLIKSIDSTFMARRYSSTVDWFIYFQSIGLLLLILRGGLLSAFAYACATFLSWIAIKSLLTLVKIRI